MPNSGDSLPRANNRHVSKSRKVRTYSDEHGWSWLSKQKAHHLVKRGHGAIRPDGVFEYFPEDKPRRVIPECSQVCDVFQRRLALVPKWPVRLKVVPYRPPAEQQGFNRYPMPSQTTQGPKFPSFARCPEPQPQVVGDGGT